MMKNQIPQNVILNTAKRNIQAIFTREISRCISILYIQLLVYIENIEKVIRIYSS